MAQAVEYDAQGKPIPSSASVEYDATGKPITAAPVAQMRAQQPSQHPVQDWLRDLNTDMTEGGDRTLPGRILGHMQARGNRGYTGLNSGIGPEAAQFAGSPVLGPIHAAQGVAETPQHPVLGPIHAAEGVAQTLTIPSMFMGGEGAEAGLAAIPSRARAAAKLTDIENAAKEIPVAMQKTQPALSEFSQSVRTGGRNASVMTKLAKRLDSGLPEAAIGPQSVKFPEARDFYTNISRATAKPGLLRRAIESPNMPSFRYNAGGVRDALNSDLTSAADTIGRGKDYTAAMNEYRRAAQLNKAAKIGGGIAAAEAARRTGLPGKIAGGIANAAQ